MTSSNKLRLFITGTDTDIGKTYISTGLLKYFSQQGLSTVGIKPVACPSFYQENRLRNADALSLQAAASIQLDYEKINPVVFEQAIAPHIAAQKMNLLLNSGNLLKRCHFALNYPADICLVEGVGGWYTPLNSYETFATFVQKAHLNVILVVGIRLGCINHAILTSEAIKKDKVPTIGWIANCIDPQMTTREESINTLKKWFNFPCLGVVNYDEKVENKNWLSLIKLGAELK